MHGIAHKLALLATVANAARLDIAKRASPLEVAIAPVAEAPATFQVTVTNTGTEDLSLFPYGSILDTAPVQKLNVFAADSEVAFTGVLASVLRTGLTTENFVTLASGATYETTIDAAAVHNLSTTGSYTFVAEGALPYAAANSTELSGDALYFKSNIVTMDVDGAAAAAVPNTISKRAAVQSDCSTSQRTATLRALTNCASLARTASSAALSGSSTKFSEYFKTTSSSTRSTVGARLSAVASECGSSSSGATTYYCTDVYGYCASNVLAYTIPSLDVVVNCPLYYSALPALSSTCHAQDQATTTLHEMTHAPGVYSPGTDDNGYGYAAATALSSARAVLNADSYALYANAIYVGC
ncbi:neutral protease 2 [Coleophoma cylindrospora]|uniref:Neutral protease 2 n=1 Tax=Coleophoma cylindrospora TaxID=1849047 RepID=A0A3D8S8M7_9HELO|nr:neutral protease 2 [Coleophoma cylindrospora]